MTPTAVVGPLVRHSPETKWYDYGDVECAEQPTSDLNYLNNIEEQADTLLKRDCELQWQSMFVFTYIFFKKHYYLTNSKILFPFNSCFSFQNIWVS